MAVEAAGPVVLPGAREQAQRLAVDLAAGRLLLRQPVELLARVVVAAGAAERDRLQLPALRVVRDQLGRALQHAQREVGALELDQRVGRRAQRLELQHAVGRVVGEDHDVGGALLPHGHLDPILPLVEALPEFVDGAQLQLRQSGSSRFGSWA